jgi:hypothetical protein
VYHAVLLRPASLTFKMEYGSIFLKISTLEISIQLVKMYQLQIVISQLLM